MHSHNTYTVHILQKQIGCFGYTQTGETCKSYESYSGLIAQQTAAHFLLHPHTLTTLRTSVKESLQMQAGDSCSEGCQLVYCRCKRSGQLPIGLPYVISPE